MELLHGLLRYHSYQSVNMRERKVMYGKGMHTPGRNRYLIDKWTVSKNPDWYAGLGQTSRIIFICRTNQPCCLSSLMLSNIVRHTAGNTSIFLSPLRHRGRVGFVRHWNDSQSPLQMKPHGFVTSRSFWSFESISVAARYLLKLEVQMGISAAKHIILTWKVYPRCGSLSARQ